MNAIQNNLLIVGPSWVGDMLMAQSLFKLLKLRQPETTIEVLAPNWSRPILAHMPEINNTIAMPIGHGKLALRQRYQLAFELRQKQYQQAIVLPNSFKSALIPWWAKIPKRTGWLGEMRWGVLNDTRRLDETRYQSMVERYAALALPAEAKLPDEKLHPKLIVSQQAAQQTLQQFKLNQDKPILALCPGAEFGPAKCWPEKHYAELAKQKAAQGWQVWLFGSEKDRPTTTNIQNLSGEHCVNLAGTTTLAQAIDLLSLATAVVTNDSGLMHIAAALNKPVVVMYGSTNPKKAPPLTDKAKSLFLDLSCSPCAKRDCPLGHLNCLNDITPEMAVAAVQELLA